MREQVNNKTCSSDEELVTDREHKVPWANQLQTKRKPNRAERRKQAALMKRQLKKFRKASKAIDRASEGLGKLTMKIPPPSPEISDETVEAKT